MTRTILSGNKANNISRSKPPDEAWRWLLSQSGAEHYGGRWAVLCSLSSLLNAFLFFSSKISSAVAIIRFSVSMVNKWFFPTDGFNVCLLLSLTAALRLEVESWRSAHYIVSAFDPFTWSSKHKIDSTHFTCRACVCFSERNIYCERATPQNNTNQTL